MEILGKIRSMINPQNYFMIGVDIAAPKNFDIISVYDGQYCKVVLWLLAECRVFLIQAQFN